MSKKPQHPEPKQNSLNKLLPPQIHRAPEADDQYEKAFTAPFCYCCLGILCFLPEFHTTCEGPDPVLYLVLYCPLILCSHLDILATDGLAHI